MKLSQRQTVGTTQPPIAMLHVLPDDLIIGEGSANRKMKMIRSA